MAKKPPSRVKNLTLAGISALTGVVTLVIVTVALIIGLWIDSRFGVRGPFTILSLAASVPISLYLMIRMALGLVKHITPPTPQEVVQESSHQEEE